MYSPGIKLCKTQPCWAAYASLGGRMLQRRVCIFKLSSWMMNRRGRVCVCGVPPPMVLWVISVPTQPWCTIGHTLDVRGPRRLDSGHGQATTELSLHLSLRNQSGPCGTNVAGIRGNGPQRTMWLYSSAEAPYFALFAGVLISSYVGFLCAGVVLCVDNASQRSPINIFTDGSHKSGIHSGPVNFSFAPESRPSQRTAHSCTRAVPKDPVDSFFFLIKDRPNCPPNGASYPPTAVKRHLLPSKRR